VSLVRGADGGRQGTAPAVLTRISICHSFVDDAHAFAIASSLAQHPFIIELLLNHNQIGDVVRPVRAGEGEVGG
jgi:hypothetical protein